MEYGGSTECEDRMKRSTKAILAVSAIVVAAVIVFQFLPHRLYGEPVAGHVVDAQSGEPIKGAHVTLYWESPIEPHGFTAHSSRDICFHAAATITDSQGHFAIPAWSEWSHYSVESHDPIAIVYARGYTPRQVVMYAGPLQPPVARPNERFELSRFSGSVDERLEVMWRGIANHGCGYGGESQKSLFPMLKAMYEEAAQIASTDAQRQHVSSYAVMAANAAIAADPNGPSNDKEVEQFISEQLK